MLKQQKKHFSTNEWNYSHSADQFRVNEPHLGLRKSIPRADELEMYYHVEVNGQQSH